jgi:hypothetical protein
MHKANTVPAPLPPLKAEYRMTNVEKRRTTVETSTIFDTQNTNSPAEHRWRLEDSTQTRGPPGLHTCM